MSSADEIRDKFSKEKFITSIHCIDRMDERGISICDLEATISSGVIIEKQQHSRDPKVIVQGKAQNGEDCYAVIALSEPNLTVVTVCWFSDDIWTDVKGLKKRK